MEAATRVLTVEEARRELRLGRSAIYEAIKRGEIPVLRFGRRIVVPRAALDRLLAQPGQQVSWRAFNPAAASTSEFDDYPLEC